MIQVESASNSGAVSRTGAMGLMQIMPDTWTVLRQRLRLGADPFDPHDNVMAGTALLRELYDRFGPSGFLAAYNAGPKHYLAYLAQGVPLTAETRTYLAQIGPLLGDPAACGGSRNPGRVARLAQRNPLRCRLAATAGPGLGRCAARQFAAACGALGRRHERSCGRHSLAAHAAIGRSLRRPFTPGVAVSAWSCHRSALVLGVAGWGGQAHQRGSEPDKRCDPYGAHVVGGIEEKPDFLGHPRQPQAGKRQRYQATNVWHGPFGAKA